MANNLVGERLAEEVRAAMARRRIPQSTLAEALSKSQAAVSRRLSGKVAFDVNELEIVASVIGIPAADLITPALAEKESA